MALVSVKCMYDVVIQMLSASPRKYNKESLMMSS